MNTPSTLPIDKPVDKPIDTSRRFSLWAPWWVVFYVALWPWPGAAEGILSFGAIFGFVLLAVDRFRHGMRLLSHEAWALTTIMFLGYWTPEMVSAIDSYSVKHSTIEALKDLRYLPFLWLVSIAVAQPSGRSVLMWGIGLVIVFWTIDGLAQAITGYSLRGISAADRLSGIFGATNLKFGIVMASMSAFVIYPAGKRFGWSAWLIAAGALGVVILLAGSRASWITFGLVLIWTGLKLWGWRRSAMAIGIGGVVALIAAFTLSDRILESRLIRTLAIFTEQVEGQEGVDHAFSGRIVIWEKALQMGARHPINGVGVDMFQPVYRTLTGPGDQFVDYGRPGAFHAHQIVLEIFSETGLLGLLMWLAAAAMAIRAWYYAPEAARERARAASIALAVTVFPLNTHLAFYSTFWGGVTLLLAALYAGTLMSMPRPLADAQ